MSGYRFLVSVSLAALLLILLAPLALGLALPHPERECAAVKTPYIELGSQQFILLSEIRAEKVGCTEARQIARDYGNRSHYGYIHQGHHLVANQFPGAVGNFGCLSDRLGSDVRSVRCREGHRAVVFAWYDSSPYH